MTTASENALPNEVEQNNEQNKLQILKGKLAVCICYIFTSYDLVYVVNFSPFVLRSFNNHITMLRDIKNVKPSVMCDGMWFISIT